MESSCGDIMNHKNQVGSQCTKCALVPFCSKNNQTTIWVSKRQLKRHEVLHQPNNQFFHLYAIQDGALKTHETSQDGKEIIHGLYLKNEVYGYDAIHRGRHSYYVTALSETVVCEIFYPNFLKLLQAEPNLLVIMLDLMSNQLATGVYRQFSLANQRLCAFLLDLSSRLGLKQQTLLLPMSYQDIGHYLGLTTETVSRLFSRLKHEKIVAIHNKQIHFLLPEKLKELAGERSPLCSIC